MMGLEKEVLHVVIKLPFQRPSNFVEPPPITWTSDMEHQIWKFLTQKRTDWKDLAEKIDVPVSHLVRHAAFMYETQLRDIQQQLRLSEIGKPTIASPPPSNTSNSTIHRQSQSSSSQQQVRPAISFSSSSSSSKQQRDSLNNTQELRDSDRTEKNISNRGTITMDDHQEERYIKTPTPTTSTNIKKQYYTEKQQSNSNNHDYNNIPNTNSIENSRYSTFNKHHHLQESVDNNNINSNNNHYDNSMMLSTISNILPRNVQQNEANNMTSDHNNDSDNNNNSNNNNDNNNGNTNNDSNSDDDMKQSIYNTTTEVPYVNSNNGNSDGEDYQAGNNQINKKEINIYGEQQQFENKDKEKDLFDNGNDSDDDDNDDDNDRLSHHIEKMRLNLEEPAFLPTRKHDGSSSLLNSLRISKMAELSSSSNSSTPLHQPISNNQHIPFSSLHLKQQQLHHQLHEMNHNNYSYGTNSIEEKENNQKENIKQYANQYIENDISHALQSSQLDSILEQQQKGKEKLRNNDDIVKDIHLLHNPNHDIGNISESNKNKNNNNVSHMMDVHSSDKSNDGDDDDENNDDGHKQFNSNSNKNRMTFGPNLNRIVSSTHSPPDDSSSLKDNSSALNSVGSSYSDISDSSVTQSALEDALMSRLNNGSKMSSLAFSRKYL